MDTNKMREQFELYALEEFGDYYNKAEECLVRSHDTYVYGLVHTAWLAWQASRQAVVVELPPHEEYRCDTSWEEARQGAYNRALDESRSAIEAQGLKVAP